MSTRVHLPKDRRGFLQRLMGFAGVSAAAPMTAQAQPAAAGDPREYLPSYVFAHDYRSLKQSSHDRTGGNADRFQVKAGATQELFNDSGPGVITHIWFTIAAPGLMHLKELVLRMYWDGNAKPSVEVPVGDFFGLNLGDYIIYQSAYLACSPGRSLNCYFSMPYKKGARMTVTNEGKQDVGAYYSNIDYLKPASLPRETLYFHAQYRQATPNRLVPRAESGSVNLDAKNNYVFAESRGRGHLMGVTLGALLNHEFWFGEGDDMIFVDDESKPLIIGTGLEDYFLGSWNWGGRQGATAHAHSQYGMHAVSSPERTGGRYICYRFHGDNPVTFQRYMKHTIEHGHANDRGDNYFSCCYWYQTEPYTDFPALPPVEARVPTIRVVEAPGGAKP